MRVSAAGPPDNSDWNAEGLAADDPSGEGRPDTAPGEDQGEDDLNDPWSMLILAPPPARAG